MKSILTVLVTIFSVGAIADTPAKMSCDWTDAQGTQILKSFASIVYESVVPGLIAKGVEAPSDPEISLFKDTSLNSAGEPYSILLVEFALVDGTKMIVSTDSSSQSLPLKLLEQTDAQGVLSGCEVQTKDLIIQGVLNEQTGTEVLTVNQPVTDQLILHYTPNPAQ